MKSLLIAICLFPAFALAQSQEQRMCAMINDPTHSEFTRARLRAYCHGEAEGALHASIEGTNAVVRQFQNGHWVIIGNAYGVGPDWSLNYNEGLFIAVSPDGSRSVPVPTRQP